MDNYPPRPPTPQAMLHRLPDKSSVGDDDGEEVRRPDKFIVVMEASNGVAGKVQIAKSVAGEFGSEVFQGDSAHNAARKAAGIGMKEGVRERGEGDGEGVNKERYQRMWLAKMMRTGLLFPEESRAASAAFVPSSSSRRSSVSSDSGISVSGIDVGAGAGAAGKGVGFINKPPTMNLLGEEKRSPVLMVITHPVLEGWCRVCIRDAVGEYGIGVVFVPLDDEDPEEEEEEELPVLKPLDPRTMTSFGSFQAVEKRQVRLGEEIMVKVKGGGSVEDIIVDVVEGVREIVER